MTHPEFWSGLITAGFSVCALFFVRFWTRTRDILFAAFALAFILLAIGQALTTFLDVPAEERTGIFVLRLVAFGVLIVAILRKNVAR